MKSLRNLKLRTFCRGPTDLILGRNHNPLKQKLPIEPSDQLTDQFLDAYKVPVDLTRVEQGPLVVLILCVSSAHTIAVCFWTKIRQAG